MSVSFLLISLLWTGLLAFIAQMLTRGRVTPYFAQAVWRFAALFMVVPWAVMLLSPLFPAPQIPLPEFPDLIPFGQTNDTPVIVKQTHDAPGTAGIDTSTLALGLLILGWCVQGLLNLQAHLRLYVLKSSAKQQNTPFLTDLSAKWATRLRLSRPPQIARIAANRSPFISGLFRPIIYLPAGLADQAHLSHIIAHECTHLAKGDLITRPLERLVASILWFSPFAWLTRARLDYYREAVCDAQTLKLTQDPVAYSRALAHVARVIRPMPTLPISALIPNTRRTLPMRISSLLEPSRRTSYIHLGFGLLALLILAPLAFAQSLDSPDGRTQAFSATVLKADGVRMTSPYGLRTDPFTKKATWHAGTDIGDGRIPDSTPIPVFTPAAGTVIYADYHSGYGNRVDIRLQQSGHVVRLSQLKSFAVEKGQTVQAGAEIGIMGSSGRSTGRHLHFEYLIDGRPYDPEEIEGLKLTATTGE